MAANDSTAQRIGDAWHHHREGRFNEAMQEFEAILKANPDNVDARYGLGLAQRAAGHPDAALKSFQQTLELVEKAQRARAGEQEQDHEDNIKTPEDDRNMMLSRMINQRLSELKSASS
jgi:tetratricopeptide (TPR) repeat protein